VVVERRLGGGGRTSDRRVDMRRAMGRLLPPEDDQEGGCSQTS